MHFRDRKSDRKIHENKFSTSIGGAFTILVRLFVFAFLLQSLITMYHGNSDNLYWQKVINTFDEGNESISLKEHNFMFSIEV